MDTVPAQWNDVSLDNTDGTHNLSALTNDPSEEIWASQTRNFTLGIDSLVDVTSLGELISGTLEMNAYTTGFSIQAPDYVVNGPAPNPVPEPATIYLLGSALAGLAGIRRREHKKANLPGTYIGGTGVKPDATRNSDYRTFDNVANL